MQGESLAVRLRAADQETSSPVVVMMCGVAGSGKTTIAQQLERDGFVRLSIDEEIWASHGRYGIDYPVEKYRDYQAEAEIKLRVQLVALIEQGADVVIDFSFWQRATRQEYRQLIEQAGGRYRLVYLKVCPEVIRERLRYRSRRFDANAAFPITEETLNAYLAGFEEPLGEGELVLPV